MSPSNIQGSPGEAAARRADPTADHATRGAKDTSAHPTKSSPRAQRRVPRRSRRPQGGTLARTTAIGQQDGEHRETGHRPRRSMPRPRRHHLHPEPTRLLPSCVPRDPGSRGQRRARTRRGANTLIWRAKRKQGVLRRQTSSGRMPSGIRMKPMDRSYSARRCGSRSTSRAWFSLRIFSCASRPPPRSGWYFIASRR